MNMRLHKLSNASKIMKCLAETGLSMRQSLRYHMLLNVMSGSSHNTICLVTVGVGASISSRTMIHSLFTWKSANSS